MRNRALALLAAFTSVILFGNVVNYTSRGSQYSESYPAVVCPPNQSGQSSFISLASSKAQVRKTGIATMAFKNSRTTRLAGSSQAVIVDAQAITPMTWQVRSGVWAGALTCLAPASSQWFVGATADVTSKSTLTLVNSGLGRALVSVSVYSENGLQTERSVAVRANSFATFQLTSLAPGSKSIAVHILSQAGRVNAFLVDERGRGLQALGGDTINPYESAAKELVIPAIPQQNRGGVSTPHTLRVFIPGEVDSTLQVVIKSTDGTFSPVGVDGRVIPAGKVVDLPLEITMKPGKFAVYIRSERPAVASIFTRVVVEGKSDFIWSTPVPPLSKSTFASTGLTPQLTFTGDQIDIEVELTSLQGKKRKVLVKGSEIATYQIPNRTRSFEFTKIGSESFGAALISSRSGYGYAPLVPGSTLTRTSIPRSNIRVLIP